MGSETIQTIAAQGRAEILRRKSRFLGRALPCPDERHARIALEASRREHPRAAHHVFAWRLLDERSGALSHRFDDDGEPGGTAGRPVLAALEAQGVARGMIVVVRYFGGIKLGAGGLVRAYAETAARALQAAALAPLVRLVLLEVRVPFASLAAVEGLIARESLRVRARRFDPEPRLELEIPAARIGEFAAELGEATAGQAVIQPAADR